MIPRFGDGRDWFFEKRFGLFVHWGIYAIPAWQEQVQWRRPIARAEYVKLAEQFNPVKFDPDEWLDLAAGAGMEYLCITTKHHDGFCLWDTKQTDFNVMNTPYKRDVLAMLADACARRGVPLELYYSCVDWHHPDYPNQDRHHELPGPEPGDRQDFDAYMDFLRAQVRELCTRYGEIRGFFWDMNVPQHRDESINRMIRELQPSCVINDRGYDEGDYGTPERHVPDGLAFARPTEACQSIGRESWGYKADEDYYAHKLLMRSVDRVLAMGGNYLLNVGPRADGTFPPQAAEALRAVGEWLGAVREALYGVEPASTLTRNRDVLLTRRENTLYVHLVSDPYCTAVVLAPLDAPPRKATLLNTGAALAAAVDRGGRHYRHPPCLRIRGLGVNEPAGTVLVVKLEFDDLPATPPPQAE